MKTQGRLLDSAQQALSKRELSSLAVANAMALMKNHLPDLDVEILQKDFIVDHVEREILVNNAYDATHDFVSLYDFPALLSPIFQTFVCCNKLLLVNKNFELILLNN
jgi:hypothetical protein